jgi:hypothetical protein
MKSWGELEKQKSIQRFSDREVIINKYIEEVRVKYIGEKKEKFRIEVKFTLKDDFEEITNNNGGNYGGNAIYISNHKSLEIWRLQTLHFSQTTHTYPEYPLSQNRHRRKSSCPGVLSGQ